MGKEHGYHKSENIMVGVTAFSREEINIIIVIALYECHLSLTTLNATYFGRKSDLLSSYKNIRQILFLLSLLPEVMHKHIMYTFNGTVAHTDSKWFLFAVRDAMLFCVDCIWRRTCLAIRIFGFYCLIVHFFYVLERKR